MQCHILAWILLVKSNWHLKISHDRLLIISCSIGILIHALKTSYVYHKYAQATKLGAHWVRRTSFGPSEFLLKCKQWSVMYTQYCDILYYITDVLPYTNEQSPLSWSISSNLCHFLISFSTKLVTLLECADFYLRTSGFESHFVTFTIIFSWIYCMLVLLHACLKYRADIHNICICITSLNVQSMHLKDGTKPFFTNFCTMTGLFLGTWLHLWITLMPIPLAEAGC